MRTRAANPTGGIDREVPQLQNGDRLTRAEFERRYEAMSEGTKAELIEGVVYMAPPVSLGHSASHSAFGGWLYVYHAATPGVISATDGTLLLDLDNEPQPDAMLLILPDYGGRVRVNEQGYVAGAPELVAEVAASSASYDLHTKLDVYRRNGVNEYVVWRVFDRAVDWFVLRAGRYERFAPGGDGVFRSVVFPGLWLNSPALLEGDAANVIQVLQRGLATPEHAAYVSCLAAEHSTRSDPKQT